MGSNVWRTRWTRLACLLGVVFAGMLVSGAAASAQPGYWELSIQQTPHPFTYAYVAREGQFGSDVHLRITRGGGVVGEWEGVEYAEADGVVPQPGDVVTAESLAFGEFASIKESITYDGRPTVAGPICSGSEMVSGERTPGSEIYALRDNQSEYQNGSVADMSYPSGSSFLGVFERPAVLGEELDFQQTIQKTLAEEVNSFYAVSGSLPVVACGGPGEGSAGGGTGGGASGGGGGGSPGSQVQGTRTFALPAPVVARTADVAVASGQVKVRLPGSARFVELSGAQQIPIGSVIDATNGIVTITTATQNGGTQTAQFRGGEFILTQGSNGLALAVLTGGDFSVCGSAHKARAASAGARAARRSASGKHVVRKLWTNAHGKFGTKGRYVVATVEGTEWLTEDLCEGSLVHVTRDRVAVTNLPRHRHVVVSAGHTYIAKRH